MDYDMDKPLMVKIRFRATADMSVYVGPPYRFSRDDDVQMVPQVTASHLLEAHPKNFFPVADTPPAPGVVSKVMGDFDESELEADSKVDTKSDLPTRPLSKKKTTYEELTDSRLYPTAQLRQIARGLRLGNETVPRTRDELARFIVDRQ